MKKNINRILLFAILIIILPLILLFSNVDDIQSIAPNFDKEISKPIGEITDKKNISLSFIPSIDVNAIEILFATYNRINTGITKLELYDDHSKMIDQMYIKNNKLVDNAYKRIKLKDKLKNGHQYKINISSTSKNDFAKNNAVTIWSTPLENTQNLMINGTKVNSNLHIRLIDSKINWNKVYVTSFLFLFLYFSFILIKRNGVNFLFKYRYCFALVILIICIFFEIHGSSIEMWNSYIDNNISLDSAYTIFGKARAIRSDEWAVSTPMAFSQYYNNFGYFSNILRGSATDMFFIFGQPIIDPAIFFRIFQIGYLFLSPERGLSLYWMSKLIALFLVSFEFGILITNDDRKLSVSLAILTTFAPIVQWWFAINGLVEMLVAGQLSMILIVKYFNTNNYIKKFIIFICFLICVGMYLFTIYPAWQIPIGYIFLPVAIYVIKNNFKIEKVTCRDFIILILGLLPFVSIIVHVFSNSMETINLIKNVSYSGISVSSGGGSGFKIWDYFINVFLPFKSNGFLSNQCEESAFISFFPIGFLLAIGYLINDKKKDFLLIGLLCSTTFLMIYCSFFIPQIITDLSLLKYSPPSRACIGIGYGNLLLLIRSMALNKKKLGPFIISIIVYFLSILIVSLIHTQYLSVMKNIYFIVIFFISCISFYLILDYPNSKNRFLIFVILLALGSGATVNPIQKGVSILKNPLLNAVSSINKKDGGLWIVEDNFPIINLIIMGGCRTINSTNTYPNPMTWLSLKIKNQDKEIWNRYAHISIALQEGLNPTMISLIQADSILLKLNRNDLKKLNVRYILTKKELDSTNVSFSNILELLYNEDKYRIYRVIYGENKSE